MRRKNMECLVLLFLVLAILISLAATISLILDKKTDTQDDAVITPSDNEFDKINSRLNQIETKIDELSNKITYLEPQQSVESIDLSEPDEPVVFIESYEPVDASSITDDEVYLIARVVQAEYGNGREIDKRLIVSVILNRLDNTSLSDFANQNTIEKVVKAPNQFVLSSKESVTLETLNAVYLELGERTNYEVLWFSSAGYLPYGTPLFREGNHWFSGIKGDV